MENFEYLMNLDGEYLYSAFEPLIPLSFSEDTSALNAFSKDFFYNFKFRFLYENQF